MILDEAGKKLFAKTLEDILIQKLIEQYKPHIQQMISDFLEKIDVEIDEEKNVKYKRKIIL